MAMAGRQYGSHLWLVLLIILPFLTTLTFALTEEDCVKVCEVCDQRKNNHTTPTELCDLLDRQCDCGPVSLITKISWYIQAILSGALGIIVLALCCIIFIAVCCGEEAHPPGRGLRRFQRGQGGNAQNNPEAEVNIDIEMEIPDGINDHPGPDSPQQQGNNNLSDPPSYSSLPISRPVQNSTPLPNLHVPVVIRDEDSDSNISTKPPSYDEALRNSRS